MNENDWTTLCYEVGQRRVVQGTVAKTDSIRTIKQESDDQGELTLPGEAARWEVGACQPVERDVVENIIARQSPRGTLNDAVDQLLARRPM